MKSDIPPELAEKVQSLATETDCSPDDIIERALQYGLEHWESAVLGTNRHSEVDNLADLALEIFGSQGIELAPHPPVPVRRAPDFDA